MSVGRDVTVGFLVFVAVGRSVVVLASIAVGGSVGARVAVIWITTVTTRSTGASDVEQADRYKLATRKIPTIRDVLLSIAPPIFACKLN
ncbi:MAG: hypothetical protein C4540_02540 [Candidatus Omnitrophota bacterium]|nr:MAG: hypothetical protein C4540_02540 [Candidatus Omnitrophota bacterium]